MIKLMKHNGREGYGTFEPMTLEEVKKLEYGDHIWIKTAGGSAVKVKVNGRVRTWKRNEHRIEVPIKYGLYTYGTFTEDDVTAGKFLKEVRS